MNNFFLMTRGRTGSTAVMNELNKSSNICAAQELFLIYDFDHIPDVSEIRKVYDFVLPYVLWKKARPWKWIHNIIYNNQQWLDRYLEEAESLAQKQGAASFGFKVLSHNFDEWPLLSILLKERNYRTIYLTRNIGRQVLSGMVANLSGIWNTRENLKNSSSYHIDLDEFQRNVEWEVKAVERDCARLHEEGFHFIVVSYEEFYEQRKAFYEKIFDFLELPLILPPKSDYSVIIQNLRYTITNYDSVLERAAAIGTPLDA